ncbi:hypothetical protein ASG73_07940 [Janibacter sp. Soil728]|uniref:hypothetical protein n=1 Tax=Janibacter sp. Soil728 TaxID=1736393 RepID=UPI0006FB6127|nr:hypothetical protein [Janibacter sp. Soil728]KRE37585.1 hypothetical protein ASG73_07940 [Janibacter sp. Soil728]
MHHTTRPLAFAAAGAAIALAIGACAGPDETSGAPDATVTVTAGPDRSGSATTVSPAGGAAPRGATSTIAEPSAPEIPSANRVGATTSRAGWVSPSGKIACTYSALGGEELARCDLRSGSLPVPQDLRGGCEFDIGTSMVVDAQGARPGCVSDAVQAQSSDEAASAGWWTPGLGVSADDEAILPYDHSIGSEQTGCESRASGMTCRVGDHGFTINDSSYTTW